MEHQLAIFPVVSHRPQPVQSFRFCLVEYYRLFSKCSEIKFSGLHYRDFPKSKLGYVTFNFFLERDDSGKNFNQCNTKMVPNISCIHKNSFSRRRFGRSISDQHFSAQLHIALQKTHICTHTHTHTHTQPRYSSPCTCCSVYSTDTAAAQDLFTLYHPTEKGSKGELNTAGYDMIRVQTQGLHFGVFN